MIFITYLRVRNLQAGNNNSTKKKHNLFLIKIITVIKFSKLEFSVKVDLISLSYLEILHSYLKHK